jgi:hypothetical protein
MAMLHDSHAREAVGEIAPADVNAILAGIAGFRRNVQKASPALRPASMRGLSFLGRALGALLVGLFFIGTPALAAPCAVTASAPMTIGSYTQAAVKGAAVPRVQSRAGLKCPVSVITVLGGNYMRATFSSANWNATDGLVLKNGSNKIGYSPSLDANGTYPFAQNTTVDYMQNNLLNVLGLLGGSDADLPIFVKTNSLAAMPPLGDYTDTITIAWSWYECTLIGINLGVTSCIGTEDKGSGTTTIAVKLTVTAQTITMSTTTVTTYDPVNNTTNPKALPLSKRRTSVVVANPDVVAVDAGTLKVRLTTPAGLRVSLTGDGTSSTTIFGFSDGSPASGMAFSYTGPSDQTDDVDFSNNNGTSWTYVPTAGDKTSEEAITDVQIHPRNAMAKGSSFTVTVPYLVK